MAIAKSKLILISSLTATGVLATSIGIGVGISHNSQSNMTKDSSLDGSRNNESNPAIDTNLNSDKKDSSSPNLIDKKLQSFLDQNISENDIYLDNKPLLEASNWKDLYAFEALSKQVKLNKDISKLGENISYRIGFETASNNYKSLNEGNLTVIVVAENRNRTDSSLAFKEIKFTGFKKSDQDLIDLFEKDKAVIDLTNPQTSANLFVTINELNEKLDSTSNNLKATKSLKERNSLNEEELKEVNGINYIFKKHSKFSNKTEQLKSIFIEGSVGLNKISTKNNQAVFELTSQDTSKFLKLVKKNDNQTVSEAVIESIQINNLLATDVSFYAEGENQKKSEDYVKAVVNDSSSSNKGYSKLSRYDYDLRRQIYFTLKSKQNPETESSIFLKPSVVENTVKNTKKLDLNYTITFGTGTDAKVYRSNVAKDLEELKNAGFSFEIFSKQLMNNDAYVSSSVVSAIEEMAIYLNATTFTKPTKINELTAKDTNNKFTKQSLSNTNLTNVFKIDLDKQITDSNKNYVLFGSYSYSGIDKENTLFSPNITLVHFETVK